MIVAYSAAGLRTAKVCNIRIKLCFMFSFRKRRIRSEKRPATVYLSNKMKKSKQNMEYVKTGTKFIRAASGTATCLLFFLAVIVFNYVFLRSGLLRPRVRRRLALLF